jgi:hypothetical protein
MLEYEIATGHAIESKPLKTPTKAPVDQDQDSMEPTVEKQHPVHDEIDFEKDLGMLTNQRNDRPLTASQPEKMSIIKEDSMLKLDEDELTDIATQHEDPLLRSFSLREFMQLE